MTDDDLELGLHTWEPPMMNQPNLADDVIARLRARPTTKYRWLAIVATASAAAAGVIVFVATRDPAPPVDPSISVPTEALPPVQVPAMTLPPPPQDCDALYRDGARAFSITTPADHRVGMALLDSAYACKPDPHTASVIVALACRDKDATQAERYFPLVADLERARLVSGCADVGIALLSPEPPASTTNASACTEHYDAATRALADVAHAKIDLAATELALAVKCQHPGAAEALAVLCKAQDHMAATKNVAQICAGSRSSPIEESGSPTQR